MYTSVKFSVHSILYNFILFTFSITLLRQVTIVLTSQRNLPKAIQLCVRTVKSKRKHYVCSGGGDMLLRLLLLPSLHLGVCLSL